MQLLLPTRAAKLHAAVQALTVLGYATATIHGHSTSNCWSRNRQAHIFLGSPCASIHVAWGTRTAQVHLQLSVSANGVDLSTVIICCDTLLNNMTECKAVVAGWLCSSGLCIRTVHLCAQAEVLVLVNTTAQCKAGAPCKAGSRTLPHQL